MGLAMTNSGTIEVRLQEVVSNTTQETVYPVPDDLSGANLSTEEQ